MSFNPFIGKAAIEGEATLKFYELIIYRSVYY